MKKVLIISYYWPPSGGSGVQRWLKFVKYLPAFGFEPHVLIPSNPTYPQVDPSLQKDIPASLKLLKVPIIEPYEWFARLTGIEKKQATQASAIQNIRNNTWKSKLALWIRSNLFIPDARMLWIRPATRALKKYLQKNKIDRIISSGPPHSTHLIALRVKRVMPHIQWFADFRDPWTNIDFYSDLSLTRLADRRHKKLEKTVLQTADRVIAVGNQMAAEMAAISGRKIDVITNGFDPDDFPKNSLPVDEQISLTHLGSLGKSRNPQVLWKALSKLKIENPDKFSHIRVRLIGNVDASVFEAASKEGILDCVEHLPYVDHHEIASYLGRSNLLLLMVNDAPNAKGIVTGKAFEYLASGRPIICLGPKEGDLSNILQTAGQTEPFDANDSEALYRYLLHYQTQSTSISSASLQYSRKELTGKLVEIIQDKI
ncbi:MAG: glycosyltransferase family 4 protein [Bacteroidota bacterium]|nr:MAG: glycosyltransferase family 4 protein [Bacteroidota bacterium]